MEQYSVRIVRSARARRLSITVKPTGEIRLTIPRDVSEREALRFLESKREWIEKARVRVAARMPRSEIITLPYSTKFHRLELATACTPAHKPAAGFRISGSTVGVTFPEGTAPDGEAAQQILRKAVEEVWRVEAKRYLPGRVSEIAARLGFRHGNVTVRNSRTRWGSCSAKNDISLSLHLMKLPYELIDYVIIHELCHTVHRNHGEKFHALLNRHTGGRHPLLRRELKRYSTKW